MRRSKSYSLDSTCPKMKCLQYSHAQPKPVSVVMSVMSLFPASINNNCHGLIQSHSHDSNNTFYSSMSSKFVRSDYFFLQSSKRVIRSRGGTTCWKRTKISPTSSVRSLHYTAENAAEEREGSCIKGHYYSRNPNFFEEKRERLLFKRVSKRQQNQPKKP